MNALGLSENIAGRTESDAWLPRMIGTAKLWQQRHHQRRQLARLDDRQLDDIGVSRSEALREARKPFWKG